MGGFILKWGACALLGGHSSDGEGGFEKNRNMRDPTIWETLHPYKKIIFLDIVAIICYYEYDR